MGIPATNKKIILLTIQLLLWHNFWIDYSSSVGVKIDGKHYNRETRNDFYAIQWTG